MKRNIVERWKIVLGFPAYKISNWGRVYSFGNKRFLKPTPNRKGYLMVTLFLNGKRKTISVHRLVCLNFRKNSKNKPQVHHKNYDKTCNYVWNLKWATCKENIVDAYEKKQKSNAGENNSFAIFSNRQVLNMRAFFKMGLTIKELTKKYRARYDTIWRIIKRKNFSHI